MPGLVVRRVWFWAAIGWLIALAAAAVGAALMSGDQLDTADKLSSVVSLVISAVGLFVGILSFVAAIRQSPPTVGSRWVVAATDNLAGHS